MSRPRDSRPRVGVASDELLVAESVQVALRERGFDPVRVPWPSRAGGSGTSYSRTGGRVEFGLVLSELDTASRVEEARTLLHARPARWLVMTGAPRGTTWGALLEAGAVAVVPSERTIDDVVVDLQRIAETGSADDTGGDDLEEQEAAQVLVREWVESCLDDAGTAGRLASLTPREREVLGHLHAGSAVGVIAATLGVTAATVRSQVKAILRKLQVNSQLAAVAVLAEHRPG